MAKTPPNPSRGPAGPSSTGITVPTGGTQHPRATKTPATFLDDPVKGGAEFFASFPSGFHPPPMKRDARRSYKTYPVQVTTVSDMENLLGHMTPAELAQVQDLLYRGGFYGSGTSFIPLYGHLKNEDYAAFESALQVASHTGQDFGNYLRSTADAATRTGVKNPSKMHAPYEVDLDDPAALSSTLASSFRNALGRAPTAKETSDFVASFHAQQVKFGEQRAALSDAQDAAQLSSQPGQAGTTPESQGLMLVPGRGYVKNPNFVPPAQGTSTAPAGSSGVAPMVQPDASGQAQAAAEQGNPTEFHAFQLGQHGQEILNALTNATPGGYRG